jgi:hypothetical protein
MRHLLANIMTYAVASLLLAGAAVFAWARSSQLVLATEAHLLPRQEGPMDGEWEGWESFGRDSYERNCANCHRSDGEGWDQYPPVSVAGVLFEEGAPRDYLIDLHLHGLTSPRWGAPMPRMSHLHDIELAVVISYVATKFGGARGPPIMPEEIAVRRRLSSSPWEVNERRPLGGSERE